MRSRLLTHTEILPRKYINAKLAGVLDGVYVIQLVHRTRETIYLGC